MYTVYMNKREQIIQKIEQDGPQSVKMLTEYLGITRAMVHRYIKDLKESNKIIKYGKAPKVFYNTK